jgi:hypothetical protein
MFAVKSTADLLQKSSHIEFLKYDMIENKDLAYLCKKTNKNKKKREKKKITNKNKQNTKK